jgi:hypothetical protein
MDVTGLQMSFPTAFCCNCGALDCVTEAQQTRVTRYFGVGKGETTFELPLPVCPRCRRSLGRPPPGFFARLLLLVACLAVAWLMFALLDYAFFDSQWSSRNVFATATVIAVIAFVLLTRLRRPKPPQTSFYQPVRIKVATVAVSHVAGGDGRVTFMKLAFTNPDYVNVFTNANREAIEAGRIAVVKA